MQVKTPNTHSIPTPARNIRREDNEFNKNDQVVHVGKPKKIKTIHLFNATKPLIIDEWFEGVG